MAAAPVSIVDGAVAPIEPRSAVRRWLPDVTLALALTCFALVDLWLNLDNSTHYGSGPATVLVVLVANLALIWRRRRPLQTAVIVAVAVAGPELFTELTITLWGHFLPLIVATWSVARWCDRRGALIGAAAVGAAIAVLMIRVPSIGTVSNVPFSLIPLAVAFATGRVLRHRAVRHELLAVRSAELERLEADRQTRLRETVEAERRAIARELHDIVAHCVSVMVIQAGAAEDLLDRDPPLARESLRTVQDTGRQAVAELNRMLGVLRAGGGDQAPAASLGLAPQPDTSRLPALVEQLNGLGLRVAFVVVGDPCPAPPGVELTAYRIVQEALTNVLKHAGQGASADVRLEYDPQTLVVQVVDDGPGGPAEFPAIESGTGGHGIVGLRERVAVCGGTLEVGPEPSGRFVVRATLPLGVV